jgi:general secretion pathway protein D
VLFFRQTVLSVFVAVTIAGPSYAQEPDQTKAPRVLTRKAREKAKEAREARRAKRAEKAAQTPPAATPPAATPPAATPPAAVPPAAPVFPDPAPPGASAPPPTNMEKIAQATDVPFKAKPGGHLVKFNLQDADLAELVNHISGLTGKRFIYGAKVRQIKATVVAPEPVTLDEAYQAFLSILEANGMTVVPHGRFLKIIDSAGVSMQPTPVVSRGEPLPEADRYITRLYRLENVSPDEIMPVLTKFKSKDGDITPYTPGRLLIITDTSTQVRRLIRIVEEVDIGGSGQKMWIEPVRHGSAGDVAKKLNELFEMGSGAPAAPGQPPGAAKGGSGLTRVVADDTSNSLIVVGTEDAYLRMFELLKIIDKRGTDSGKVHVLRLQHAIAEELAATLTQMLAGQAPRAAGQPAAPGNAGGMFEGEVRVTADKSTNSLLITSSGHDYATLRLVVDKLDRPRRQVFIEAVIMDLSVSDTTDLGVSFHGGHSFGGGPDDPLLVGGFKAANSITLPLNTDLLEGSAVGMRAGEIPGTQSLLGTGASIPAFGIVLNALASSGKSNVLATPHIIATDNVAAEINIGENIPLQTNVGSGTLPPIPGAQGAAAQQAISPFLGLGLSGGFNAPRQDVGNKIKVTPHINESNQVRLEIEQESSAPGAAVGQLGAIPITKRTANTTVVVADQQTVVIGGLMRDEYVTSREKIPVLGDLPVLGALFRHSNTIKRKANLLLVLTPHVIREQADLRRIFERKMQERQEFIDRYFVFQNADWRPPRDWSRANGLVEDIRKSYAEIEEQTALEEESRGPDDTERTPSSPIELPTSVRESTSTSLAPAQTTTTTTKTTTTKPAKVPKAQQPKAPAKPAPARSRGKKSENESPIIINPIARSVNVERVE